MGTRTRSGFDRSAAITRSLLGWGVVAGPFYLAVGLGQAFTRDGFELSRHPLSLLMLGELGWIQAGNLIVTGLMVLAAAVGFVRVMQRWSVMAASLALYGVCLILSAIALPDAMAGFPPGSEASTTPSVNGLLHLAAGGTGFFACGVAAFFSASWFEKNHSPAIARLSRVAAVAVLVGFIGGVAMAAHPVGITLIWLAVVAGFAWLLGASLRAYRIAPHPDRVAATAA